MYDIALMEDYQTTQTMMRSTVNRINQYGKRGEKFDHLINRLLDEYEELKR